MAGPGVPFDDADLEDGWDASDTLLAQFDNAVLRIREMTAGVTDQARRGRLLEDLATIRRRIFRREL
jgi:hypothetical protein